MSKTKKWIYLDCKASNYSAALLSNRLAYQDTRLASNYSIQKSWGSGRTDTVALAGYSGFEYVLYIILCCAIFHSMIIGRSRHLTKATSAIHKSYVRLSTHGIVTRRVSLSPLIIFTAANNPNLIAPTFLERARVISSEHAELSKQLALDYDANIAKRLGELSATTTALQEWKKASEVHPEFSLARD